MINSINSNYCKREFQVSFSELNLVDLFKAYLAIPDRSFSLKEKVTHHLSSVLKETVLTAYRDFLSLGAEVVDLRPHLEKSPSLPELFNMMGKLDQLSLSSTEKRIVSDLVLFTLHKPIKDGHGPYFPIQTTLGYLKKFIHCPFALQHFAIRLEKMDYANLSVPKKMALLSSISLSSNVKSDLFYEELNQYLLSHTDREIAKELLLSTEHLEQYYLNSCEITVEAQQLLSLLPTPVHKKHFLTHLYKIAKTKLEFERENLGKEEAYLNPLSCRNSKARVVQKRLDFIANQLNELEGENGLKKWAPLIDNLFVSLDIHSFYMFVPKVFQHHWKLSFIATIIFILISLLAPFGPRISDYLKHDLNEGLIHLKLSHAIDALYYLESSNEKHQNRLEKIIGEKVIENGNIILTDLFSGKHANETADFLWLLALEQNGCSLTKNNLFFDHYLSIQASLDEKTGEKFFVIHDPAKEHASILSFEKFGQFMRSHRMQF